MWDLNPGARRHFSSSADEAFWAWRKIAGALFDVALRSPDGLGDFKIDLESYNLGGLVVSRLVSDGQIMRRAAFTIARTGCDHYIVQTFIRGGYAGRIGDRPVEMSPGDICILDMAHTLDIATDDFESLILVIPRSSLLPLMPALAAAHGIVLPAETPQAVLLGDYMRTLFDQAGRFPSADAATILAATASLVAACVAPVAARMGVESSAQSSLFVRICQFVGESLREEDLSPERISQGFGVSRATLYRLFEPHGGVVAYIRQQRLERCFQELTTPSRKSRRIADVAFDWGFDNEAAFSRNFRRAFGVSPREARRAGEFSRQE